MIATQQHDVLDGVLACGLWRVGRDGFHRSQLQRYPGCGDELLQMRDLLVVVHPASWQQREAERSACFEQGSQLLQQGDKSGCIAIKRATQPDAIVREHRVHPWEGADPHRLSGLLRGNFGVGQHGVTGGDHIPFCTQPAQILPRTALTIEQMGAGFEARHKGCPSAGMLVVQGPGSGDGVGVWHRGYLKQGAHRVTNRGLTAKAGAVRPRFAGMCW